MEALRNDAVHSTEPIHTTLPCESNDCIDELSKEKEEELLYGAGDDGEEEDALSDDSMRLRLSDDEAELEDTGVSGQGDAGENKVEVIKTKLQPPESVDVQSSSESKKVMVGKKEEFSAGQDKGQNSGNVSMGQKDIVRNGGKHKRLIGNGHIRPQLDSGPSYQYPMCNSQWTSMNYSYVDSYRNANYFPYPRRFDPRPIEYDRYPQYEYESRFYDRYSWSSHDRNNGNRNIPPLLPTQHQYIPQKVTHQSNKGKRNPGNYKSKAKNNIAIKLQELQTPPGNISIVTSNSCSEVNDLESMKGSSKQLGMSQDLENKDALKHEQNTCSVNQLIDTNTVESNLEINAMDVTCETKFAEEGNEGQKTSEVNNDVETKAPAIIEVSTCNEDSCEKPVHSSVNSQLNKNNQQESNDLTAENIVSKNSGAHTPKASLKVETSLKSSEQSDEKVDKREKLEKDINNEDHSRTSNEIPATSNDSEVPTTESTEISIVSDPQKVDSTINNGENTNQSDLNNHVLQNSEPIASATDLETSEPVSNIEKEHQLPKEVCKSNSNSEKHLPSNESKVKPIATESQRGSNIECNLKKDGVSIVERNVKRESSEEDSLTSETLRQGSVNDTKSKTWKADTTAKSAVANNVLQELNNVNYEETIKSKKEMDKVVLVVDIVNKQSSSIEKTGSSQNDFTEKHENEKMDIVNDSSKDNAKLLPEITVTGKSKSSGPDAIIEKSIESLGSVNSNTVMPVQKKKRGRKRKKPITEMPEVSHEETKVNDTGRQKRQTAKNAEEIIRKKFLNNDSDLETSDASQKLTVANRRKNTDRQSTTPVSLKRGCPDNETMMVNGTLKKLKAESAALSEDMIKKESNTSNVTNLNYVYKFFQRDLKEKLPKLTQEELEELLIQKIVETITMQGEIGRLREQARIAQRNQEATRTKCQQLAKQIKDFEMVLGRYAADRRAASDKAVAPIKINRSVGLQVNFTTEHGMQNLRQLQQTAANTSSANTETSNGSVSPRRGIKIRPPRRIEMPASKQPAVTSSNHVQPAQVLPTVTPAALMVTKSVPITESKHNIQIPIQANKVSVITNPQQLQPVQQVQVQQVQVQKQVQAQAIVLNGKVPIPVNRPEVIQAVTKPRTNDLIDLTDEEEKNKAVKIPVVTTVSDQITIGPKGQPCFQRVLPTIPGGIAVTGQAASIRVVQPASQPTPTALVNNMSSPRLAYVMQSGDGSTRQLLITSNSNTIRPVTSGCRPATFPALTYKTAGISTLANGTVRVLTTPANPTVQLNQHPAPLPDAPTYAMTPSLKLPPPAPTLKISRGASTGATGIVLSWNMALSDKYADIVSYQLYAYQEVSGVPPSSALWKKVGDVRALPLPMACTLTQFSKGNNYHFAVRAVDTHSRKGQYSIPGNISL